MTVREAVSEAVINIYCVEADSAMIIYWYPSGLYCRTQISV